MPRSVLCASVWKRKPRLPKVYQNPIVKCAPVQVGFSLADIVSWWSFDSFAADFALIFWRFALCWRYRSNPNSSCRGSRTRQLSISPKTHGSLSLLRQFPEGCALQYCFAPLLLGSSPGSTYLQTALSLRRARRVPPSLSAVGWQNATCAWQEAPTGPVTRVCARVARVTRTYTIQ